MRTCYIDVTPEQVKGVVEKIESANPDSVLLLTPVNPISTYAPTKKKKYHRINIELVIPDGALNNVNAALTDFGCMAILRVPKEHISEKYLKKEDTANAETD